MSTSTKVGPSSSSGSGQPILEVRQICKSFPGVRVLKSVNLSIWPGEVHAFMGENGAGKSTLMKILAGAYRPDSGEILMDGKPIQLRTPHESRMAGIGIIYQELTVAPNLTVSGNVFLGSELKRLGFMTDTAEMERKTQEVLNRLGARVKATGPTPWLVVIALLTIAVSAFILHRTILGVHIYAVGGNAQAARLTGIPVPFILIFSYGVSGLRAGLGGVMSASRLYSAQGQLGVGYELDAIAAVILGGTSFVGGIGTVFGTLIGALIIAVLNNGLTLMNVSFYWQLVIKGAVIILAVMLDKLRTRGQAG